MSAPTCSYVDLRPRCAGDVARTVEVIDNLIWVDVDHEGRALGIEKISNEPISSADLFACLTVARFRDDLCAYYEAQFARAVAETLELRLQIADGPRARVRELEATVECLNATVAARNSEIESLRKKGK